MQQLNRVELRGKVGSVKVANFSDRQLVRFTVATNYAYKDDDGCACIDTSWHNVVAWRNDSMPDFGQIERGADIYIQGRLRYSRYLGTDGEERIATEVVANKVELLSDETEAEHDNG